MSLLVKKTLAFGINPRLKCQLATALYTSPLSHRNQDNQVEITSFQIVVVSYPAGFSFEVYKMLAHFASGQKARARQHCFYAAPNTKGYWSATKKHEIRPVNLEIQLRLFCLLDACSQSPT